MADLTARMPRKLWIKVVCHTCAAREGEYCVGYAGARWAYKVREKPHPKRVRYAKAEYEASRLA